HRRVGDPADGRYRERTCRERRRTKSHRPPRFRRGRRRGARPGLTFARGTRTAAHSPHMDRIMLDMHMHTEYSRDSRVALAAFAELAGTAQLGAVCITDHDTIEGGLRLREMNTGLQVIVGEEITTADGELVGLYLSQKVAAGLSAEHSIDLIHEQGGLAYVPHPFSRNRRRHLRRAALEHVAPKLDLV